MNAVYFKVYSVLRVNNTKYIKTITCLIIFERKKYQHNLNKF